jgi:hypothetical protein
VTVTGLVLMRELPGYGVEAPAICYATSVGPTGCAKVSIMQEPDSSQQTKLLKIGTRQCRYIVSDDLRRAICCGAPTPEGSSWCD